MNLLETVRCSNICLPAKELYLLDRILEQYLEHGILEQYLEHGILEQYL